MATPAENLTTAYANVCKLIADLTENPKPSYMIDGQSVQWTAYLRMLIDQRTALAEAISAMSPFEVHHRAFT